MTAAPISERSVGSRMGVDHSPWPDVWAAEGTANRRQSVAQVTRPRRFIVVLLLVVTDDVSMALPASLIVFAAANGYRLDHREHDKTRFERQALERASRNARDQTSVTQRKLH